MDAEEISILFSHINEIRTDTSNSALCLLRMIINLYIGDSFKDSRYVLFIIISARTRTRDWDGATTPMVRQGKREKKIRRHAPCWHLRVNLWHYIRFVTRLVCNYSSSTYMDGERY